MNTIEKIFSKQKFKSKLILLNKSIRKDVKEINDYFKNEYLLNFYSDYKDLVRKKLNNKYFTYWGINFKDNKVHSIKFYAHVLDDIFEDEILKFIPSKADFNKFLSLKAKNQAISVNDVGTVLELKFIIGNKLPRHGFFYMIDKGNEIKNRIGFPKSLPEELIKKCISVAVNFEYEGEKSLFKKYFYFYSKDSRDYFQKRFEAPISKESRLIEYSESDSFSKINIFGSSKFRADKMVKTFSKKEKKIIKYFNKKFGLINFEYGFYDNKEIKSIYFFDEEVKHNLHNLEINHQN